ncbi:MAG TPA: phosphatase PAP2 family protein [Acidimicrobiia bacterium]|nr:phosphatase PAP2 family protein [Acidimicrobiia bacterium]
MIALAWIPWNVALEAGAVVGSVGLAAGVTQRRRFAPVISFTRELTLVLVLYAFWRLIGMISVLKVDGAIDAGQRIWDVERALHLPSEHGLQHLFMKSSVLIQACNVYYATMHFPAMLALLVWMWVRHREKYPEVRNVVALTTLGCLAIQLIPVAPPRLVPALHVADTPALFGQTVYPAFGRSGPAQLSAMPSVHVAWAVIVAIVVVMATTSRWRWLVLAHPIATTIVVVVTGNHYWLDGVVAVMVLALAVVLERGSRRAIDRLRAPRWTPVPAAASADARLARAREPVS